MQERFQFNVYDDADDAIADGLDSAYADYFHPNVWPTVDERLADVADLEPALRALYRATRDLAELVMTLFAVALELDDGYFTPLLRPDVSCLAINHYPAAGASRTEDTVLAEHSDSGTVTVLHQRGSYDGLQVKLRDGRRVTVPTRPECFVVNIGDLMARWSNDRWAATPHRVIGSPDSADWRTSLTLFHLPAIDTVVAPLSTCVGASGAHYGPVTPYAWERMFLDKAYS